MLRVIKTVVLVVLIGLIALGGLQSATYAQTPAATAQAALPPEVTLTFGAYSVPREAYSQIIPLFQDYWLKKTGQKVSFKESYQGSGAQSRAVASGFEADVVALALEKDITRISDAKLITSDWKKNPNKGIPSTSVVVLAVRPGNPKQIKDWADLGKEGVEVITPDPASSGGAQWNLLAAYGAAKRGKVAGYDKGDDNALKFLGTLLKNVSVLDKDARESFLNFERGVGDVAITYENEAYAGLAAGEQFEIVYPSSTILIETPVAVVDVYVDKHGTRPAAEAFVAFLWTPEVQQIFAKYGFRPVDPNIAKLDENVKKFPAPKDLFTIEEFGGWNKVGKDLFGDTGTISKLLIEVKGK
jgi:sulfate transport system substrate-binding protein